jgi:hypothetical protein
MDLQLNEPIPSLNKEFTCKNLNISQAIPQLLQVVQSNSLAERRSSTPEDTNAKSEKGVSSVKFLTRVDQF